MKIEDTLRHTLNITDQNEIDEMMQILINEGDVDAPFILEKDNGLPKLRYVGYEEFKINFRQIKQDSGTYGLPLPQPPNNE